MMKKIVTTGLVIVMLGIMGVLSPGFAMPQEEEEEDFPLYAGISDLRVGTITIHPGHAHYTTNAYIGSQNGARYYELMAYNPSGTPLTVTWGMKRADMSGSLKFDDSFDSSTLSWIQSFGLSGATYSIRML